jgi:alpha-1,2-mannosyltransferase
VTAWARRVVARIDASARVQWWAAFAPLLLLYLATMRFVASSMSADPTGVVPSAWGIVHGDSPIIAKADWPYVNPWFVALSPDQVVSNRPPGLVYLAVPGYWLFRHADTWEPTPASITAALVTAAAVATFGLVIRRLIGGRLGPRIGIAAAGVLGLATTTWAVSGTQLFPHGPDQLLLVLAMVAIASGRSWGVGLAFAAAVTIRPPLAVVAAVWGAWRSWADRSVRAALVIGSLTAAGLAGFALYSHHYWNMVTSGADGSDTVARGVLNATATHGYFGSLTSWSPHDIADFGYKIAGALVSPGRGLLIGAPFLVLLLPGLRRAWRASPDWVRAAAVGGLVYLIVQLKVEIFTGGQYFWSYRYPLEAITLWGPLLVLAWQRYTARTRLRRAWFGALVSVAIGFQAVGAFSFHGPYPDTPWTFDNLAAALAGDMAAPGWVALIVCVCIAVMVLVRGYRRVAITLGGALRLQGQADQGAQAVGDGHGDDPAADVAEDRAP